MLAPEKSISGSWDLWFRHDAETFPVDRLNTVVFCFGGSGPSRALPL